MKDTKASSKKSTRRSAVIRPKDLETALAKLSIGPAARATHVRRTVLGPLRNGQNGAVGAYAMYFTLADLYDVADLTSNFDLYRLTKVQVEFRSVTPAVPSASTAPACVLLAAVDLDDSNVPTLSSISHYEKLKIACGHQSLKFVFEPRYTIAGDNGANNLIGLGTPGSWLDCATTGVVHRGIKYFITASAAASIPAWQIVTTYFFEFARQR